MRDGAHSACGVCGNIAVRLRASGADKAAFAPMLTQPNLANIICHACTSAGVHAQTAVLHDFMLRAMWRASTPSKKRPRLSARRLPISDSSGRPASLSWCRSRRSAKNCMLADTGTRLPPDSIRAITGNIEGCLLSSRQASALERLLLSGQDACHRASRMSLCDRVAVKLRPEILASSQSSIQPLGCGVSPIVLSTGKPNLPAAASESCHAGQEPLETSVLPRNRYRGPHTKASSADGPKDITERSTCAGGKHSP